jgi:hypothetical protein
MRDHFKGNHRDQMFLLPPSVKDWLPAGDLAWFLMDAVGQMKLSGFYARYRSDGKGQAAFEPAMRVKRLEREASEAVQKHAGKVAAREKAELDSGKKPRGRKPQEPDAAPTAERSANVTQKEDQPCGRVFIRREAYPPLATDCVLPVGMAMPASGKQ